MAPLTAPVLVEPVGIGNLELARCATTNNDYAPPQDGAGVQRSGTQEISPGIFGKMIEGMRDWYKGGTLYEDFVIFFMPDLMSGLKRSVRF